MAVASLATISSAQAIGASGNPHGAPGGTDSACSRWVNVEGFSDHLDKTVLGGVPVSELSGLTYDTNGQLLAVADDSFLFTLDAGSKRPVSVQPVAYPDGTSVDAEAIAVDHDGTRLITDETQPAINRFTRSGRLLESLPVPDALKVAPLGRAADNLTFEGMALLPEGRTLVASMEGALEGDGTDIRRFQTWHRAGHSGKFHIGPQYAFQTDPGLDISDISSTGDGRLLVLERGYTPDVGNTVRLYLADVRHATDVSKKEAVPTGRQKLKLVHRTLLADIGDCPSLGATAKQPQPNPLLDNIEAITVTGRTRDGRVKLLLVSDDNQRSTQITRLYSLDARLPKP
ncbi:esterase-like activity of phytase family protein [Actinacidiphila sp. bgisy167]|uniref:esterase-like activity of phytase family protein n=1 Tax=Actinacidiphila sp. bgisy167 TaxID=3413797 RepID=UPI003D72C5C6